MLQWIALNICFDNSCESVQDDINRYEMLELRVCAVYILIDAAKFPSLRPFTSPPTICGSTYLPTLSPILGIRQLFIYVCVTGKT